MNDLWASRRLADSMTGASITCLVKTTSYETTSWQGPSFTGKPDERPSSGSGEAGRSTHLLRDTKQSPKGTSTLTSPTEMKVPGRGSQHLVCNTALAAGCRPS